MYVNFYACLFIYLTGESVANSNFNYKKQMLKNASITIYPQKNSSRIDKRYYNDHRPSPHNHILLINEETMCSQHYNVFLLVTIRTIYSHFERRKILRQALQSTHAFRLNFGAVVKHVFLFGKTSNATTEELIRNESRVYKDIIQEDFIESYSNLTYKTVMAWKWSIEYCPNTEYVMITNDELFIDIEKAVFFLLSDLARGNVDNHFAICYPIGNGPVIHKKMHQFIILDQKILYQGKFAPLYCHGYGYTAHITVINKLYKSSQTCPFFMPDDMWLGLLTEKLRLKIINHRNLYVTHNVVNYFVAKDYLWKPGMFAICDNGVFGGHASTTEEKLFFLLQEKYNKFSQMQKNWSNIEEEQPKVKTSLSTLLIPFLAGILIGVFMRKIRIFYKCRNR